MARAITALALIAVVLACFSAPSPWFVGLLAAAAGLVAWRELGSLLEKSPLPFPVLGTALWCAGVLVEPQSALWPVLLVIVTLVGLGAAFRARTWWLAEVATLWVFAPLAVIALLHTHSVSTNWTLARPALFAIVPLWAGDTAAYFVGRRFGKRLLAPTISPKKTVEGAVANLLCCVFAAVLLAPSFGVSYPASAGVGLSCGLLGQIGDLSESALKRRMSVKDSGALLPGHGGLLDRIDSLLLAAPVSALILQLVAR